MKKLFLFTIFLSVIFVSCDTEFFVKTKKHVYYDPKKAGATIIESYNITDQISFFDNIYINGKLITDYYGMALYENKIYILTKSLLDRKIHIVLYIFDKNNFDKVNEIIINFTDINVISNLECESVIVLDNNNVFIGIIGTLRYLFFSLDMKTGNATLIDNLEEIGIIMKEDEPYINIGYDRLNKYLWSDFIQLLDTIYFYSYNLSESFFTLETVIEQQFKFLPVSKIHIYGNNIFETGYSYIGATHFPTHIGIEIRSISNLEQEPYFINVEYLGTRTLPQNIVYDEPYIWLMVERDNQIQMLKLLPNG